MLAPSGAATDSADKRGDQGVRCGPRVKKDSTDGKLHNINSVTISAGNSNFSVGIFNHLLNQLGKTGYCIFSVCKKTRFYLLIYPLFFGTISETCYYQ